MMDSTATPNATCLFRGRKGQGAQDYRRPRCPPCSPRVRRGLLSLLGDVLTAFIPDAQPCDGRYDRCDPTDGDLLDTAVGIRPSRSAVARPFPRENR